MNSSAAHHGPIAALIEVIFACDGKCQTEERTWWQYSKKETSVDNDQAT